MLELSRLPSTFTCTIRGGPENRIRINKQVEVVEVASVEDVVPAVVVAPGASSSKSKAGSNSNKYHKKLLPRQHVYTSAQTVKP